MLAFFKLDGNFPLLMDSLKKLKTSSAKILEFFYGILKKNSNIFADDVFKNIRIFLWNPKENIGSLLVFHKFSVLISLEISSIATWLKQKLDLPIVFLIATILGRF